ncbi:tail fiber domain-containing protein [Roseovarius faecimaris]|nr:tail fiber domain-containing protein [Roseovarius faecimaris]
MYSHLFTVAIGLGIGFTLSSSARADQVIADDLIVSDSSIGRICVGGDCANGESFPTSIDGVIKMSANRNIIDFIDTSGSTFPDRDWRIQANENEGAEAFFIQDLTRNSTPFYIIGGAPTNAVFIAQNGNIGMGTTLPEGDLHVLGALPRFYLEATSGQKWNMNIGSFGFVLNDSASAPQNDVLLIENGTPRYALTMRSSGNVGLGTFSPSSGLHLLRDNGKGAILIEETSAGTLGQMTLRNNGITFFTLEDTSIADVDNSGRKWNFQNQNGTFRVTTAPGGPGEIEMILTPAGDMTIEGALTQNSDKHKKMAIEPVDPGEILQKVAELPVSSWMYKDNADLGIRHIGPMAQDFHAAFGVGASETGISSLDTSGVALAAIQALEAQNAALEERLAAQEARAQLQHDLIEQLLQRLADFENNGGRP